MKSRTIRQVAHRPRRPRAPGFALAQLHPEQIGGGFDPFLQIDAFRLGRAGVQAASTRGRFRGHLYFARIAHRIHQS